MNDFRINILDQYWISDGPENIADFCSHGLIDLKVNETVISDKNDVDWTISTTGLMLLRTINSDHNVDEVYPIVQHCGMLEMLGCPISIDWSVAHQNDKIIIKDIKKYPTTNKIDVIEYKGLTAIIDRKKYIREIVGFCNTIKEYFKDQKKEFENERDRDEWKSFWAEFDQLLDKHKQEINN